MTSLVVILVGRIRVTTAVGVTDVSASTTLVGAFPFASSTAWPDALLRLKPSFLRTLNIGDFPVGYPMGWRTQHFIFGGKFNSDYIFPGLGTCRARCRVYLR